MNAWVAQGDLTDKVLLSAFQQPLALAILLLSKIIEKIARYKTERSEDCLQTDPNACNVFAVPH